MADGSGQTSIPVTPDVRDRIGRLKRREAAALDQELSYNDILTRLADVYESMADLSDLYDF